MFSDSGTARVGARGYRKREFHDLSGFKSALNFKIVPLALDRPR